MNVNHSCCTRITGVAAALLAFSTLLGCGGSDGPRRYTVEGTVTFDGKPVPAGDIAFEPDTSKGNQGPAGYADIKNGRYVTSSGKGAVGGPHIVRINGSDGNATPEQPYGGFLFEPYTVELDLPKENTTHDFVVPAAAP